MSAMASDFQSPRAIRDRNQARADAAGHQSCFLCGRGVVRSGGAIHLTTAGQLVGIDTIVPPSDDQGWFVVGPECVNKLPADYVREEVRWTPDEDRCCRDLLMCRHDHAPERVA